MCEVSCCELSLLWCLTLCITFACLYISALRMAADFIILAVSVFMVLCFFVGGLEKNKMC